MRGDACGMKLPDFVRNTDGTETGVVTGVTKHCQMEGCTGVRLHVRWSGASGKTRSTWPCSKGMKKTEKEDTWQIE